MRAYRAIVRTRTIAGKADEWRCDHRHVGISAAAKCSQISAKAMMPNNDTKVAVVKYQSLYPHVLINDPNFNGGEWWTMDAWNDLVSSKPKIH